MKHSHFSMFMTVAATLMVLVSLGCASMSLSAGRMAYTRGDYPSAAARFMEAAEAGIPEAQFRLGYLYQTGRGVVKSETEADRWFQAAAENGWPEAQSFLGVKYYLGSSVVKDYGAALKYLKMAADQGEPVAMYYLSRMYRNGEGVEKSPMTAYAYLLAARAAGFPVLPELEEEMK